MVVASLLETPSGRECPTRRVVQLCRCQGAVVNGGVATHEQHLPIRQQRRRMGIASLLETSSGREGATCRVIQLRRCKGAPAKGVIAASDEHFTIRQQRRRMVAP